MSEKVRSEAELKEMRKWLVGVLREGVVNVTFTKSDGSERVMKCTLNKDVAVPYETKTDRKKPLNEDVLPVWDIDKGAWRSFRVDSVKEFSLVMGEK